ncbi:hypothetical protein HZS_6677 [Henneguya salminicola]|nr:hypothetical protein HZS_6677 [Henneguya salminicola]
MEGVVTISSNDKQKMTKFQYDLSFMIHRILFTGVTFFILGIASMIPRSSFTLNLPVYDFIIVYFTHKKQSLFIGFS